MIIQVSNTSNTLTGCHSFLPHNPAQHRYVFPLTIGDGSFQLSTVLSSPQQIGNTALAVSTFAKMFTYHVCKEAGFVGGIFFPCIIISSMLGGGLVVMGLMPGNSVRQSDFESHSVTDTRYFTGIFINVTGVNPVVGTSCAFVAMCGAFIPMPFFLILLSISCLSVGPQGLIPVFATVITAYLFCIGVGIPQGMLTLSNRGAKVKGRGGPNGELKLEAGAGATV